MQKYVDQAIDTGTADITDAWTDITWLLYNKHVSWAYYVQTGDQPDCDNDSAVTCPPVAQSYLTPGIWNPLPVFEDVQKDHQLRNIQPLNDYFAAAKNGTLPSVMWVTPSQADSEHPPASVHQGQAYVTAVINAAMKSPDWDSTAIFLQWDDWGGFYDNVVPPPVDQNGYGLRVPGLVISPYAKHGLHRPPDAVERRLPEVHRGRLPGRLAPQPQDRRATRPPPDVREDETILGNMDQRLRLRPGAAAARCSCRPTRRRTRRRSPPSSRAWALRRVYDHATEHRRAADRGPEARLDGEEFEHVQSLGGVGFAEIPPAELSAAAVHPYFRIASPDTGAVDPSSRDSQQAIDCESGEQTDVARSGSVRPVVAQPKRRRAEGVGGHAQIWPDAAHQFLDCG